MAITLEVKLLDAQPEVVVGIRVLEFSVRNRARSPGWDVIASVRLALRVAKTSDAEDFTEFVYTAERSGRSFLWPGIRSNERILAECLDDLAQLVSEREALAAALARHAGLEPDPRLSGTSRRRCILAGAHLRSASPRCAAASPPCPAGCVALPSP